MSGADVVFPEQRSIAESVALVDLIRARLCRVPQP
jgi:hypothetical protein